MEAGPDNFEAPAAGDAGEAVPGLAEAMERARGDFPELGAAALRRLFGLPIEEVKAE